MAVLVVNAVAAPGCTPVMMDDWGMGVLISDSRKG